MTREECYNDVLDYFKRDTYKCDKCKIVPKYSMKKFNKDYKPEFEKRFNEIWAWHIKRPTERPILLGDIGRLRSIVLGRRVYNDPNLPDHYRFQGYDA